MEMDNKYVLHIPLCKFTDDKLVSIDMDDILAELTCELDSFYITRAESHYKSRSFEELLITVFAEDDSIEKIFKAWFIKNNGILAQEAFAYEHNNKLIIEKVK